MNSYNRQKFLVTIQTVLVICSIIFLATSSSYGQGDSGKSNSLQIDRFNELFDTQITNLRDADPKIRANAVSFLGSVRIRLNEAVSALAQALTDEDRSVRAFAAEALGSLAPAAHGQLFVLTERLNDKDWFVRGKSAVALGRIARSIVETNKKSTSYISEADLQNVVTSLARALLQDEHEVVRVSAAFGIGKVGPTAKNVVPMLNQALKDSDANVRESAKEALRKINI